MATVGAGNLSLGIGSVSAAKPNSLKTSVVRAAETLFDTPYISVTWLAETLGVTFPTTQSAINALVSRGDLTEATGRKRNRFYFAARIFEAVYGTSPEPEQPRLFD